MWKLIILPLFLTNCSMVVKESYIDREIDLVNKLDKNYKDLEKNPSKKLIEETLSISKTYYKRMDYKIKKRNERSKK